MNYANVPAAVRVAEPPSAPESHQAGRPVAMFCAGISAPAIQLRKEEAVQVPSSDVAGRLLSAIAHDRSPEAFADLFDRYAGRLKHFFVRGGIGADRAEELVQEVLLAIWRRADTFDGSRSSAVTWIYTLARNRRIDELRLQGHAAPKAEDLSWDATEIRSTEGSFEQAQRQQALRQALLALPPEQRAVLQSSFFDGKSLAEVAGETGLPLGTVKSRARLAIERLRRVLHSREDAS